LGGCEDPIQLGAGLVDGEINDPEFTDTFDLVAKTITSEPPITFRNSVNFTNSTYLVGEINDPVFGRYSSVCYFDSYLSNNFPDLNSSILDSIILVFALDSLGQYGNEEEIHNLEIYQLDEVFDVEGSDTLVSDIQFEFSSPSVGRFTGKVSHRDSLTIYNPSVDTLIRVAPELRVPFDTSFWSVVARDTTINNTNENLSEFLRGFALVSVDAQNSLIGLVLDGSSARIDFYYTNIVDSDTAKAVFPIFNGLNKHNFFEHDYTGTPVEAALEEGSSQEVLYLQSMAGVNMEFDLSPLLEITDTVVVNNAVIELTVVEPDPLYPPINRLLASYRGEDGDLFVVEDIALSSDFRYFGGGVREVNIGGVTYNQYNLNITNHLNNLLDGTISETKLEISSFSTQEQGRRSEIYGAQNQVQPAKIKLIITKP